MKIGLRAGLFATGALLLTLTAGGALAQTAPQPPEPAAEGRADAPDLPPGPGARAPGQPPRGHLRGAPKLPPPPRDGCRTMAGRDAPPPPPLPPLPEAGAPVPPGPPAPPQG